jgi:RNA polymerase sigma-70 factor (ECF subfamily)
MSETDRAARERLLRKGVLAGDSEAWTTLYEASFDALRAYVVWRCGGSSDQADEVLQDVWLIAVRSIRRFDPAQAAFATWLQGIAGNVLRNRIRREQTARSALGQAARAESVESSTPDTDQSALVAAALVALPERYEAVLKAKYFERLTVAEIAGNWSESTKAVESLLTRARDAFRKLYQQINQEGIATAIPSNSSSPEEATP